MPRKDGHHGEDGKKKPRPHRSFTPEFKAAIVELCRRGDRSVGQIAKDFDLIETAVRLWVSQAETDAGERGDLISSEREELADCGGRTAGCGRTWRSSSGPRFSSRRRLRVQGPAQLVWRTAHRGRCLARSRASWAGPVSSECLENRPTWVMRC
ncbi:transposase [Streptomyces canus]|uniref:transposase n=1 Tax=Streptomyces canus TaxID=58343 RepID=UPI00358E1BD6